MHVVWNPAITLDGYIALPDGNADWVTDEDGRLFWELVRQAGCVIVGRTTYDMYRGEVYPVPGATTFVWTSRPETLEPAKGVMAVSGTAPQILAQVAAKGFTQAVLAGGGRTNNAFAAAGLIDEVIANIYPVLFGSGIKILDGTAGALTLELRESRPIAGGLIRNYYNVKKS